MASDELKTVLELLASTPTPEEGQTFEQQRAAMEAATAAFPVPDEAQITPVEANGVPGEWVEMPGAAADRAILYLHGGGYVIGSPKTHRALTTKLAEAAGTKLLAIDYRMGPEDPCPAAIEDAVAAYRHLLDQGYAPARLAISGDSAGGGLTMATLVALRDQGLPLPAAGAPISPWVDLTGDSATMETRADADPMVQREGLRQMAAHYLGGRDPKDPEASPLFADLAGLPPLLVQVGDHETLLDDSRSLAEKAKAAGVEVDLEVWPEMIHVWHMFHFMLPEGTQALDKIGAFLQEKWAGAGRAAAE